MRRTVEELEDSCTQWSFLFKGDTKYKEVRRMFYTIDRSC